MPCVGAVFPGFSSVAGEEKSRFWRKFLGACAHLWFIHLGAKEHARFPFFGGGENWRLESLSEVNYCSCCF
jgi:hypothetical protein